MRLLLDTHVAVWAIAESRNLSSEIRDLIADGRNAVFVSVVSLWEIAIKHSTGRRGAPPFTAAEARHHFATIGFSMLAVTSEHALEVEKLPRVHADPFDRLLVAQALAEPLRLVTRDRRLSEYGDIVLHY